MTRTYGFGIIGTGMIANFHANAIEQSDRARLVAVMDRLPERAREFAGTYGCKTYSELEALLDDKEVDIVTIATPSGMHMEPTIAAAEHGKHVICEKPLEVNLERVDRMIEAHARAGTTLAGIFNVRYEAVNRTVKALVASGRFGTITYGGGYVPWWRSQEYYDQGDWRGTWRYDGGGALMNQGAHTVDLLQWLMGSNVKRVTAFAGTLAHERLEVEDTISVALEFESGALGVLFATTTMQPGLPTRVEIGGTGGTVICESTAITFLQFTETQPQDEEILKRFGGMGQTHGTADPKNIPSTNHRLNFEAVLDALDVGGVPEIDGVEARKTVEIITSIYESARTGRPVTLG